MHGGCRPLEATKQLCHCGPGSIESSSCQDTPLALLVGFKSVLLRARSLECGQIWFWLCGHIRDAFTAGLGWGRGAPNAFFEGA